MIDVDGFIKRRPAAALALVLAFVWVATSLLDWAMPAHSARRTHAAAAPAARVDPVVRSDAPEAEALKSLPVRPEAPTIDRPKFNIVDEVAPISLFPADAMPSFPMANPEVMDESAPIGVEIAHDEHDWLMTHSEAVCVALVVWAEARGEPLEGKVAVADLVLNRVDRNSSTPCDVTREPSQFAIGGRGGIVRPTSADPAWRWCLFAAVSALRDREGINAPATHADATRGARCMVSPANMPRDVRTWPAWAHGLPLAVIGGHAFFPCPY